MSLLKFLVKLFTCDEIQELCPEHYLVCDDEYFNEYYDAILEE